VLHGCCTDQSWQVLPQALKVDMVSAAAAAAAAVGLAVIVSAAAAAAAGAARWHLWPGLLLLLLRFSPGVATIAGFVFHILSSHTIL
jgi:hypothetical protein